MTHPAEELRRVLQEFFDRRARGESPSPREYLDRYPQLRKELAEHFQTVEALDRLVKGEGEAPGGETVLGDFRIVREIGQGGFGRVFLAHQLSLQRPVALKLLRAPRAQSYRTLERFRHEAEIAARLHHPNLVAVYSEGEAQGYSYYAMEHVEGVSLDKLLAELRRLGPSQLHSLDLRALVREIAPPPVRGLEDPDTPHPFPVRSLGYFGAVAQLMGEIADGLAFAHGRGVIHRDVKPGNILVDRALVPHVADFGLAKETGLESLTVTGDLVGAIYYLSPEIAMAGRVKVDHRTDIYSLGVTFFEMLTLRVPFQGNSSHEVLRRIVLEPPPAPRKLNHAIPRDLQVIALKAMEKDPEHRYATAAEMAEDLRRFLRFEPIRATPPGPIRIAGRYLRRHRVAVAVAAVLLVGAAAGTATATHAIRRARVEERVSAARTLEQEGELAAALRGYEEIERDFGEGAFAVREERARVARRIAEERARLLEQAERNEQLGRYPLAARDLEAALEFGEDPALRTRFDEASGFVPVRITSGPSGASVVIHSVDEARAKVGPGETLGATPLPGRKLHLGSYRIRVEKPGFGFGEYELAVRRGEADRGLHAILRPTSAIVDDMVAVPGGRYRVGWNGPTEAPGSPPFPLFDLAEGEVAVPPFYLDRTEVSNGAYARFVRETGRRPPRSWVGGVPPPGGEKLPVVGVTWDDARSYAEWAGKRLPTEVEWEVACRGPDGLRYSWGNEFVRDYAHVGDAVERRQGATIVFEPSPAGGPVAVDSVSEGRDTSPFGILHLVGNVEEWVWDPWTPREAPPPEAWWLTGNGERVYRGSSWRRPSSELSCQCSARNHRRPDYTSDYLGFRCAKSAPP